MIMCKGCQVVRSQFPTDFVSLLSTMGILSLDQLASLFHKSPVLVNFQICPSLRRLKLSWSAESRFKEAAVRSFGRTSRGRPGRVRKAIRFSCLAFSEARRYERASIELEKVSLISLGFGPGRPSRRASFGGVHSRFLDESAANTRRSAISSDTPMAITSWFTG